jgi:hypothetical protein
MLEMLKLNFKFFSFLKMRKIMFFLDEAKRKFYLRVGTRYAKYKQTKAKVLTIV